MFHLISPVLLEFIEKYLVVLKANDGLVPSMPWQTCIRIHSPHVSSLNILYLKSGR